jgi:uncharacterized protein YbaP (TraB family)
MRGQQRSPDRWPAKSFIDVKDRRAISAAMNILSRLGAVTAFVLAAFAPLSGIEAAQYGSAPEVQIAPQPAPRPALWKVADDDTTIYVFGTIHVLPPGIDWFAGEIRQAFESSQLLVTEVESRDVTEVESRDPQAMQALVIEKAMLKDARSLREMLSEDERVSYEKALLDLGLPPGMFDRFEPWYVSINLSTLPLMQEGYSQDNGVEKLLEARARERSMDRQGLETAEYQLGLFDTLPMEVQKNYLGEIVAQLPELPSKIDEMIEAWKTGEVAKLAELMNEGENDPVMMEVLLIGRNKAWAKWIARRMEQPGTVFLAVGTGHLAGEGNLFRQLAADGIASKRLQ